MSGSNGLIKVLLVDDDQDFTEVSSKILQRRNEDFEVYTARDAEEGLELLDEHDIDCVVSDYEMPGVDGVEFLDKVRDEYRGLPFVLFTGKGSEDIASEAISAGVTDYVQKQSGADHYAILANRITNAVEQRKTEQELQRSEDRLRMVLHNLPHPVFVVDEDMTYRLSNEAHAESHDRSVDEIEGVHSSEVLTEGGFKQFRGDVQEVISSGETKFIPEVEVPDDTGETNVYEARLVPFDLLGSDKDAVLGVSIDITDHKEQKHRLRKSQRRFEAVFNSPDTFIGVLDTDGSLLKANEAALDFIDAEPGDVEGELFWETEWWNHSEELQRDLKEGIERAKEGDYVRFEAPHYGSGGEEVIVDGVIRPVENGDGEIVSLIVQGSDISELRERERRLQRQNERLEKFTGIVSHDLRNPLSVATGRLELAMEEIDNEHLEAVDRAHERMQTLIDELLMLAREGETVTYLDAIDLGMVVEKCWLNVEAGDAELVNETDSVISADENRLSQLLENLFRNAVEHGGDDVTVRVGELEDGFFVEDDGSGIPTDLRDRVMESGYSTTEEGTGFGLSIVREIAAAHGWDIEITQGGMGGARFEITGVVNNN